MASYWKSQPRKFCDVCHCWIGDNKASIDFHERGKSHQEKKKKQLDDIKKRSTQQAKENSKAHLYLKQMEKAAKKSYMQDLKDQGVIVNKADEEKFLKQYAAAHPVTTDKKQTVKPSKPVNKPIATSSSNSTGKIQNETKAAAQNIKSVDNVQPYGKWVVIESPKETTSEQSIPLTAAKSEPAKIQFSEKRVVTVDSDSVEPVAFKKRKQNSCKKVRSIRDRTET